MSYVLPLISPFLHINNRLCCCAVSLHLFSLTNHMHFALSVDTAKHPKS